MDDRPDIPLGYTRDDKGKVLTCKGPEGDWFEYTYSPHGTVSSYKTSEGEEHILDPFGNVIKYRDAEGYSYEFTRDALGNILTYKDSVGDSYEYTRDSEGRVLTFTCQSRK